MTFMPTMPQPHLVYEAIEKFDKDCRLEEETLTELFKLFPSNDDLRHVLIKVLAVNSLYHTHVLALQTLAEHIAGNALFIDVGLCAGLPEVVDTISKVEIQNKTYNLFSFASKYCSWHHPSVYPIYDSRVYKYLRTLQKLGHLRTWSNPEKWNYADFCGIMEAFREQYGLGSFTFKQIDKFLYIEGGKLLES